MAWPMRRVLRMVWWILCTATFCALPLTIWEFRRQDFSPHYAGWFIAGIFVILTIPISVYGVAMHTEYYTRPRLQRHVVRIIWLVPVFSLDAWFSLRFMDARVYLHPIRECYEAYVLYNFYIYLMNFLEDELGDIEGYIAKKPERPHAWPLRYFMKPWKMGAPFLYQTKKGILNYVILRPLCTAIAYVTNNLGIYGDGKFDLLKAYPYLTLILNFAQAWALYCLVMFYVVMHDELSPIRPLSKFACIKLVVFVTYWQKIVITVASSLGWLSLKEPMTTYTAIDVSEGLQDFMITVEMFLAAILYAYSFPPRDYMDPNIPTKGFFLNVKHMFDLRDVVEDVQDVVVDHVQTTTHHGKRAVKKAATGIKHTPNQLVHFLRGSRQDNDSKDGSENEALLNEDDRLSSVEDEDRWGSAMSNFNSKSSE